MAANGIKLAFLPEKTITSLLKPGVMEHVGTTFC